MAYKKYNNCILRFRSHVVEKFDRPLKLSVSIFSSIMNVDEYGTYIFRIYDIILLYLEILNTASSTRKLMNNIKRRQAEFLGHVMRKGKLEHLLTTGKIEGKRSRGRQRIKIQDGIAAWLGRSTAEMFVDARDRKKWKVMIAYACNRHGN